MGLVGLVDLKKCAEKIINCGREELISREYVMRVEYGSKPERIHKWTISQHGKKQNTGMPRFMW